MQCLKKQQLNQTANPSLTRTAIPAGFPNHALPRVRHPPPRRVLPPGRLPHPGRHDVTRPCLRGSLPGPLDPVARRVVGARRARRRGRQNHLLGPADVSGAILGGTYAECAPRPEIWRLWDASTSRNVAEPASCGSCYVSAVL